jgi:hypothetical protein
MTGMNEQRGFRKRHQGEVRMTANEETNQGRVGRDFSRMTICRNRRSCPARRTRIAPSLRWKT